MDCDQFIHQILLDCDLLVAVNEGLHEWHLECQRQSMALTVFYSTEEWNTLDPVSQNLIIDQHILLSTLVDILSERLQRNPYESQT